MIQHVFIVISAGIGFALSFYIYRKTMRRERLVCMLGEDCNKVVYSRYAKVFGIQNAVVGLFYYGAIGISYIFFLAAPQIFTPLFLLAIQIASGIAAIFSIYLIFVQISVLREWCEWCLLSTCISIAIFILTLA